MPADDQEMAAPEQHPDEHAAMAAEHAMAGMVSNEDLHLRLTPVRPAAPGDSARAAETLAVMRRELAKYGDVRVAQDDGFREFIPAAGAPVRHFTKLRWAIQSRNGLDPARPTSLLYQAGSDGSLTLVGARRRWRETKDGQPLFGPKSPIATAEACEAVGGRFRPRLFGWMVHVMAFAGVDPWNAHHH